MTEEQLHKVSPADLRKNTHEELPILPDHWKMNANVFERIREELSQRFLGRIGDLTEKQIEATNEVRTAVDRLTISSDHLEGLTMRLNRLTWILIVLTALAVIVPVGIEIWKAKREIDARLPPVVLQPPPHSASQTPIPPPGSP
jgi:hypothetical protein